MIGQNNLLSSQYQETLKNKEQQANTIQELKQNHLALEAQIRQVQRDFVERDSETANQLSANHSARRAEHLEHVRKMVEVLNANLKRVGELQDLEQVDELVQHYKQRIDDLEEEIEQKDSTLDAVICENHDSAVSVDQKRSDRSNFESQNLDLVELRGSYDKLLLEHNRLKGQNQGLECELREANAELRTATETQVKEGNLNNKGSEKRERGSPLKGLGSGEKRDRFYGSGSKNNGSASRNRK